MSIPLVRDCFLTIQGGGVYFLTMLGQAQALIEDQRYNVLGLAGTSAGAILSSLLWSGLSPSEIRERVLRLAAEPGGMTQLLGPPREGGLHAPFDFKAFSELTQRLGIASRLAQGEWSVRAASAAWRSYGPLRDGWLRRGFFPGRTLEDRIDGWIKEGLYGPKGSLLHKLRPPEGERVRFADLHALIDGQYEGVVRPPLFVAVTNLSSRQLQVVRSFMRLYRDVEVATIARASGSVPGFFEPVEMPVLRPSGGVLVDGGVVSNYPAWVFEGFRAEVREREKWGLLSVLPLIRAGLRVVDNGGGAGSSGGDASTPVGYLRALLGMLTGSGRNQLEDLLADRAGRALTVRQPVGSTAGPSSVVDFGAIDRDRAERMIELGRIYANTELTGERRAPGIFDLNAGPRIAQFLAQLCRRMGATLRVMGLSIDDGQLRASVFVPSAGRLVGAVRHNMEGFADADLDFDSLESGLTGRCFSTGRATYCNLELLEHEYRNRPELLGQLFGMTSEQQQAVQSQEMPPRWMVSVPISDPFERPPLGGPADATPEVAAAPPAIAQVDFDEGPRFPYARLGVLNIDGLSQIWKNSEGAIIPAPGDVRLQVVVEVMRSAAESVSLQLAARFDDRSSQERRT